MHFSEWKSIFGLSDSDAAGLVHADGIQVLFDLSGHTKYNRLPMFAWKPAPVQATGFGYFATTGVEEIDYILGDPVVTPVDEESHFVETVWRLPQTYISFSAPDLEVSVNELPCLSVGHITFGCFNSLSKINDTVISVWSRILVESEGSKLFLKTYILKDPTQNTQ